MTVRTLASLIRGTLPERLAVWSVLRPRRYDATVTAAVLEAASTGNSDRVAIGA